MTKDYFPILSRERTPLAQYITVIIYSYLGDPEPLVGWSREGAPLPPDHLVRGGVLRILRVRPSYAGTYICTVKSGSDVKRISSQIVVNGQCLLNIIPSTYRLRYILLIHHYVITKCAFCVCRSPCRLHQPS